MSLESIIKSVNWQELQADAVGLGGRIIGAILLTWVGFKVAAVLSSAISKGIRRSKLDETLGHFLAKLGKWATISLFLILSAGIVGIQTASFAALIAALGLALGLSLQGTLSNFSSGVMLLVFRPFSVGQFIKVGGESGTVKEIGIFSTELDTVDNRRIIIPNSSVFGNKIENVSYHSLRRVDITVGTAYEASTDKTMEVLLQATKRVQNILREEQHTPSVTLTELNASSVDWSVRVWVEASNFWTVKHDLLKALKASLDEAKISIPYPQLSVHLPSSAEKE